MGNCQSPYLFSNICVHLLLRWRDKVFVRPKCPLGHVLRFVLHIRMICLGTRLLALPLTSVWGRAETYRASIMIALILSFKCKIMKYDKSSNSLAWNQIALFSTVCTLIHFKKITAKTTFHSGSSTRIDTGDFSCGAFPTSSRVMAKPLQAMEL